MAARAVLRERHLAARQHACSSFVRYALAARRVLQLMARRRLEEEQRHVERLRFGGLEVGASSSARRRSRSA